LHNMDDAVVFSKKYCLDFPGSVDKPAVAELAGKLIQDIGRPLAHNGIIVGHIKVLAKWPDEEFIFLSLTRLAQVDVKKSAQWTDTLAAGENSLQLDINVLLFGHTYTEIETVVLSSLAQLRRDSGMH
jgi:hypothetical protein